MQALAVLDVLELRRVASHAEVDGRTLARIRAGRPVRPSTRARVARAIRDLGLDRATTLPLVAESNVPEPLAAPRATPSLLEVLAGGRR